MKKQHYNNITKQFNKSNFKEFTYNEIIHVLTEYKLEFMLVSRLLNGIKSVNSTMYIESENLIDFNTKLTIIERVILLWLKDQMNKDLIPPNTIDFSNVWSLIIHDSQINIHNLSVDQFYISFINSNKRNKVTKRNNLKNKGKYHVNQGGKFGRK